ncbi:MAG: DUF4956 domain-containing protein [Bacteroidetes bacterium]|nr:DUF4956 domain-containing protein [Bacteroidota bacterium]
MTFNTSELYILFIRLFVNLIFMTIIIRFLYYPITKRKDYLFTYYLIGTITFFLCFSLKKLDIDTGMGLGLFAIFGIIRYRTDAIEIKEMTYLFLVIGLSVVNAMLATEIKKNVYEINMLELLFINSIVCLLLFVLEYLWLVKHETRKIITYDRIDLISSDKYDEMKADLEQRTGIKINRCEVGKVDFLRDIALIQIFYYSSDQTFSNFGQGNN